MSRHKLVKNMVLDDELGDFDGGDEYDYDGGEGGIEELSEEDQEQMRIGTIHVREALPPSASNVTDKQIQEALWHYYYDGPKSVAYLVTTYGTGLAKKKEKAKGKKIEECFGGPYNTAMPEDSNHFSFADFFRDTPWLNIPHAREAILIAPLYPRGGLLGGSSNGAPKMSKLQALAAARKKKAQEQKSGGSEGMEQPMACLKLGEGSDLNNKSLEMTIDAIPTQKHYSRGFPVRKRKDSNPHEKPPRAPDMERESENTTPEVTMESPPLDQAEPSAFANTMFSVTSQSSFRQHSDNLFSLPYVAATAISTADPFAGPSPDDVVIAAQSKASGKGGKGPPKTSGEKRANQIANGAEATRIDDSPRATSKNLDVLAEFEKAKIKNAANFVVIGHVDAGKSTLMGRLLYDLKVVDQRTIDRYRKEAEKMGKSSFALAWVLDQGSEERARGVTIDIAMNKFETEKTSFTILDAPGHRDFIPNMIAGAAQADFAVLVIDASTGSFESGLKGQTKEHALLVRSMGVQRLIIAVNKLDTVNWDQERYTEIQQQVSAFLIAAGFQEDNLSFIPCSGLLGDNIVHPMSIKAASWYTGPSLIQELDNSEPVSRALTKPLRLTISDIFRSGVQNPLSVSTRIDAGSLQTGDALLVQPAGMKCFIKSIERDNETVDWAVAGQNIILNISGIEEQYLNVGDVMCSPGEPVKNVKEFSVKILAFEFLTPMSVDVHKGRLHVPGKIKIIKAVLDKGTGVPIGRNKVRFVKPGQVARVVVELERECPLEAPGRVVLRNGGETVGAGLLE